MKLLSRTSQDAPSLNRNAAFTRQRPAHPFWLPSRMRRDGVPASSESTSSRSGIALIVVMICVTVLTGMALAFARLMQVENKLTINANADANFYPVARGAVDYCISVLVATATCPDEVWEAGHLNSSCTNGIVDAMKYEVATVSGRFTWGIYDLDRIANINRADQPMLERAMRLLDVDPGDSGPITASILDWISPGQNSLIGGTESSYYETLDPPIKAKDGYMDDLSELRHVRGVTPELCELLKPLFTPISSPAGQMQININTASDKVLQLLPFIDENTANQIIMYRSGQETGQPTPFRNVGELINVPGINAQAIPQLQRLSNVRSTTFEVQIKVEIGGVTRHYNAILYRRSPRDIQVLTFYWNKSAPDPASHADAR